eukprot:UN02637
MADDELQVHGSPGSSSVVATHLSSSKQVAMADDELQVHGSPGSSGSTNSCLRTLAQETQRVFRIPHRTVLDSLLAHLELSPDEYERVVHEDGKIHVTVSFNTSTINLGGPISDISVPGLYCTDDEAAEDTAMIKAIP